MDGVLDNRKNCLVIIYENVLVFRKYMLMNLDVRHPDIRNLLSNGPTKIIIITWMEIEVGMDIGISIEASLVAQRVKNLPAMWETQVRSLGWEDPLQKGMATHSSILAGRIPQTEEPGGLHPMGLQGVGHE